MIWTIDYTETVIRQLKKLGKPIARRILRFLREQVASSENPRALPQYRAMTGHFRGLCRFRVAKDYRVICDIQDQEIKILVIKIGHRREVYDR